MNDMDRRLQHVPAHLEDIVIALDLDWTKADDRVLAERVDAAADALEEQREGRTRADALEILGGDNPADHEAIAERCARVEHAAAGN